MQLQRKIIKIGNSEGIVIPKIWLESIRKKTGQKEIEIIMDINGSITLTPIIAQQHPIQNNENQKEGN